MHDEGLRVVNCFSMGSIPHLFRGLVKRFHDVLCFFNAMRLLFLIQSKEKVRDERTIGIRGY